MAKTPRKIICSECGKRIRPGNDENGLPNGVGFVLETGKVINYCKDCIIQLRPTHAVRPS